MAYNFELLPVWEHYSDKPLPRATGSFKVLCPIHEESRPSATVNLSKNTWFCFVCDRGGDALDLIDAMEGGTFADRLTRAQELTGEDGGGLPPGSRNNGARTAPANLFSGGTRANSGNANTLPGGSRGKPRGLRR